MLSDTQFDLLSIARDHAVGLHQGASLLLLRVRFDLPAEVRATAEQHVAELKASADGLRRKLSDAIAERTADASSQRAAFEVAYAAQQHALAHFQKAA